MNRLILVALLLTGCGGMQTTSYMAFNSTPKTDTQSDCWSSSSFYMCIRPNGIADACTDLPNVVNRLSMLKLDDNQAVNQLGFISPMRWDGSTYPGYVRDSDLSLASKYCRDELLNTPHQ